MFNIHRVKQAEPSPKLATIFTPKLPEMDVETCVRYFLCENNADKYEPPRNPNVFRLKRAATEVNMHIIKKRLEALGTFKFYFKTVLEGDAPENFVWEEVIDDYTTPLPMHNNCIFVKALRIEDRFKGGARQQPGFSASSSSSAPSSSSSLDGVKLPTCSGATSSSQALSSSSNSTTPNAGASRDQRRHDVRSRSSSVTLNESEVKVLEQLEKTTHFSSKELRSMYSKFKKEAPTLSIDRGGFAIVTEGMGITEKVLQEAFFNKWPSGFIDFPEFVNGMSIMTRGTPEEKLEAAFRLYDLDGNGIMTREAFLKIMESFKQLRGGEVVVRGTTYTDVTALCNQLFDDIDADGSGGVDLKKYTANALKHMDVLASFGVI
ncbi:calcium-binding protein [Pelomyxa schiedti]|nr:calcium-binding protein [Pelomyxa schiedti]